MLNIAKIALIASTAISITAFAGHHMADGAKPAKCNCAEMMAMHAKKMPAEVAPAVEPAAQPATLVINKGGEVAATVEPAIIVMDKGAEVSKQVGDMPQVPQLPEVAPAPAAK